MKNKGFAPTEEQLNKIGVFFKIMGDATRLKILTVLLSGNLCVKHISEAVEMSQSAVSHQLAVLKSARLIKSRREGKQIYYSLDDAHIGAILCTGISHVEED